MIVGMTTSTSVHDWRAAGEAWGSHANDWSCLYEHYAVDVLFAMFTRLQVGPGVQLLDIACGSGLAARIATGAGATVAGIDASEELISVARVRLPDADLRVGSMYELPWTDASFDAAVSVNGIWGGGEIAIAEAFRVLRPGGMLALSFWGQGPPLDIKPLFRVFAVHAPDAHRNGMRRLNDIATPGVAEEMLRVSGFEVLERGNRISVMEFPDDEIAWRAISSFGPGQPALRTNDVTLLKREVLDALAPLRDARGVYRTRSDQQFVIARKP
jgi:ubiquinone/menaquinone biosynthesis C-methylase UbiE